MTHQHLDSHSPILILWPTRNPANCAQAWPEFITGQAGPKSQPTTNFANAQKLAKNGGTTYVLYMWHSKPVECGTHCGSIAFSRSSLLVYLFVWLICCCLFWFPAQMPSGRRRILVDFYIDCVVAAGVRFPLRECMPVLQQISVDKQSNGKGDAGSCDIIIRAWVIP